MNTTVSPISISTLLLLFIPISISLTILFRKKVAFGNTLYAFLRMIVQLIIVGFTLTFIFASNNGFFVIIVLLVMILFSSWISIRTLHKGKKHIFPSAFLAILIGGGFHVFFMTQIIIRIRPWFYPTSMIPLAGMIFSSSLNGISLFIERFQRERNNGVLIHQAEKFAFHAALIPAINNFFAVGLVSFPGLMTGQILSGISPFVAVRYQIVILTMIVSSQILVIHLFSRFIRKKHELCLCTEDRV